MRRQIKTGLTIGVGLVLAAFTGCFFEKITWSPDGRYVVYSDYDKCQLWRWDSRTGETQAVPLRESTAAGTQEGIDESVNSCRYLPSGKHILVVTGKGRDNDVCNQYLLDVRTGLCDRIASGTLLYFDVSSDGNRILYMKTDKEKHRTSLLEYTRRSGERTLLSSKAELAFPSMDPAGKRILYSGENQGLCLLDSDKGTTRSLLAGEKRVYYWPRWMDGRTVLYVTKLEDQKPDLVGDLEAYSLDDKTTRTLCKNVHLMYSPISFSPDRKSVVVTAARVGAGEEVDENRMGIWQVASANVTTGEITWLTDTPFGALAPVWSPDGKRVAYLSAAIEGGVLNVVNLETRKTMFTWRNEEEHLFANAESAAEAGDSTRTLTGCSDLIQRFPQSKMCNAARYRMTLTYLGQPQQDLDAAYQNWQKISDTKLRDQIRPLFWREEDRVATDPAEDWIQTYGTEASQTEFKLNTDLTRDLRALWVRCGKERLYVRIDYGSDNDLTGLTFQDTLILLRGEDTRATMRRISPTALWDRPADRQILIRHWFESGNQSQYDMEILNEKNEVIARYLASGFAPPANPLFERAYMVPETNSVVYAVSRQTLGLVNSGNVGIQVCTFKGGIESVKGLERPRVASADGRTVCDVADAFGAENTKDRIEADLKANTNPAAPAVIKGVAGTIKVPATPQPAPGSG
jgi:Tol biopolymer transport system component